MSSSSAPGLAAPDQYLQSFEGDDAVFVAMDRAAYRRSIFLDHRISCAAEGVVRLPVAALAAAAPPRAPTDWIFHVAHCGSTLLARALDALGDALVLREPLALRQLALSPDADRLRLALAFLSRHYPGSGATLIKANVPVNFLLDEIVRSDRDARALFLFCTLRDYLLAILRSNNHRAWLRTVTGLLARHLGDLSALSDAQCGAVLWLAQLRQFAAAIAEMPNAKSLDAEVFFADPAASLRLAAQHFGRPADPQAIEGLVKGPLFNTYSKNPEHAFDNAARQARRLVLGRDLSGEIKEAERWIETNGADAQAALRTLTGAALGTNALAAGLG
jgi:hypothetical protein